MASRQCTPDGWRLYAAGRPRSVWLAAQRYVNLVITGQLSMSLLPEDHGTVAHLDAHHSDRPTVFTGKLVKSWARIPAFAAPIGAELFTRGRDTSSQCAADCEAGTTPHRNASPRPIDFPIADLCCFSDDLCNSFQFSRIQQTCKLFKGQIDISKTTGQLHRIYCVSLEYVVWA